MRNAMVWCCALLVAGGLIAGCKKDEEPLVQESETANAAPTPLPTAAAAPAMPGTVAVAELRGPNGVMGLVTFTQEGDGVRVVAQVQGAMPGQHGFHLHAGGSCDSPDFKAAGDHFNPNNATHGDPFVPPHHAGDFGNIEVGAKNTGNADLSTPLLSVGGGGPSDVLGKTVILHGGQDDLSTQPSGNSGARIACGVVQPAPPSSLAPAGEPTPMSGPPGSPIPGKEY